MMAMSTVDAKLFYRVLERVWNSAKNVCLEAIMLLRRVRAWAYTAPAPRRQSISSW
jgi:hypothetical protein